MDQVDAGLAAEAGRLLGRTKRSDTVDAFVTTTALRLAQPTIIPTSDPHDLEALTEGQPQVQVVAL